MSSITVEEFITKLGFEVDGTSLAHVESTSTNTAKHIESSFSHMGESIRESFHRAFEAVAPLVEMAAPLLALFGAHEAIEGAARMEALTVQMGVLLGNAEAAEGLVHKMQDLAQVTPMTTMDIATAAKQLIAFRVPADQVIDKIRQIGDVAGGNSAKMQQLAEIFGKVSSGGKLTGRETMEFTYAGFNPLAIIQEHAQAFGLAKNISIGELQKLEAAGKISYDMVAKIFDIATSKGGMFYKAMEKGSQTLSGLWSTVVDNIEINIEKVMQTIMPVMKDVMRAIIAIDWQPMVEGARAFVQSIDWKSLGGYIMNVATVLKALFLILTDMYPLLVGYMAFGLINKLKLLELVTGAVTLATQLFGTTMAATNAKMALGEGITTAWGARLAVLKKAAPGFASAMGSAFASLLNPLMLGIAALTGLWMLYNKITNDTKTEFEKQQDAFDDEDVLKHQDIYTKVRAQKELQAVKYEFDNAEKTGKALTADEAKELEERRSNAEKMLDRVAKARERVLGEKYDPYADALKDVMSHTKNTNFNVKNTIHMPVTVDDKGDTKLSATALHQLIDTRVRSVFNVQLIGIGRGIA